jgi:hypothetical protein
MFDGAQTLEKNHLLPLWNRSTVRRMVIIRPPSKLLVLKLIAAAIALATLAPMVVLAGQF